MAPKLPPKVVGTMMKTNKFVRETVQVAVVGEKGRMKVSGGSVMEEKRNGEVGSEGFVIWGKMVLGHSKLCFLFLVHMYK